MNQEQIRKFLSNGKFDAIVDATHPFAREITCNIQAALKEMKQAGNSVPYLRLKRDKNMETPFGHPFMSEKRDRNMERENGIFYFDTNEACAKALEDTTGNILLTIGSKELFRYCISERIKRRLYVRVLPSVESLSLCIEQGICGKQIIAMQGPFTEEMNEAIIRQYEITCLVTKESGIPGGFQEKINAAKRTGTKVFVIGCPEEVEGYSFSEICRKLEDMSGKKFLTEDEIRGNVEMPCGHTSMSKKQDSYKETPWGHTNMSPKQNIYMEIILAGIGMGHVNCLTKDVEKAISEADILLGAERMLKTACFKAEVLSVCPSMSEKQDKKAEKYPFYQAKQIIPYLQDMQKEILCTEFSVGDPMIHSAALMPCDNYKGNKKENKKVVILFSGDSGFYSGCQALYAALEQEIAKGRLKASLRILPGISSVAYLASCIGESYHDAEICSIHGKKTGSLVRRIKSSPKTFLITSGIKDINRLGELLTDAGMSECEIITGYQLSYEEQRIESHTPVECRELKEEGLYTCFVKNPYAMQRKLTHGMADEQFIRDKVPMTKEEIREVSICKLHLTDGAVVYDIGSGTGSVAIEIAGISDNIQVYAVEQNHEAVSLIEKNKEKFELQNITVAEEEAPEGFAGLPMATHAFIGGSGGRLKEILASLWQINSSMRVVINAVSMETICEIKEILSMDDRIKNEEVVQLQVSRAKKAGSHHLMQSENPVWICAFEFSGDDAEFRQQLFPTDQNGVQT